MKVLYELDLNDIIRIVSEKYGVPQEKVKKTNKDGIENPTMASLFDGIGGFPLTASRANIKPLWASEIEDFPIAVTKERFKENGKEKA